MLLYCNQKEKSTKKYTKNTKLQKSYKKKSTHRIQIKSTHRIQKKLDKRFFVYYDVYIEYKEVQKVSKEEKRILKALGGVIPKLSEFQKGYLLGIAEAKADERNKEEKNSCQKTA